MDACVPGILLLILEDPTPAEMEMVHRTATSHDVFTSHLQEAHMRNESKATIPGFHLWSFIPSKHHGLATYAKSTFRDCSVVSSSEPDADLQWNVVRVQGLHVFNVYKSPPTPL